MEALQVVIGGLVIVIVEAAVEGAGDGLGAPAKLCSHTDNW